MNIAIGRRKRNDNPQFPLNAAAGRRGGRMKENGPLRGTSQSVVGSLDRRPSTPVQYLV